MHRTDHDTSSDHGQHHFAVGVLCGAAVGAAIGLLLAPKSGAQLRSDLSGSARRLRRTVDDGYRQATEMVDHVIEEGRDAVRQGKDAFDRTRDDFTDPTRPSL
jgi:gas vesicle protein